MSEEGVKPRGTTLKANRSLLDGGKFALGLSIGGSVVLVLAIWLSLTDVFKPGDSTLLGAVVGGFLAGFISLIATILTNYFMLRDSEARKIDELETIALSCFQKLHSTRDTMVKAYRH